MCQKLPSQANQHRNCPALKFQKDSPDKRIHRNVNKIDCQLQGSTDKWTLTMIHANASEIANAIQAEMKKRPTG